MRSIVDESHWTQAFPTEPRQGFSTLARLEPRFGKAIEMVGHLYSQDLMDRALLIKVADKAFSNYFAAAITNLEGQLNRSIPGRDDAVLEAAEELEQARKALQELRGRL